MQTPDKSIKEFIVYDIGKFLDNILHSVNVSCKLTSLLTISLFIISSPAKIHWSKVFLERCFEVTPVKQAQIIISNMHPNCSTLNK